MRSFVTLFALAAGARAESREAKEKAAKKACLTGKPDKGVELLTDLFIESNDANYIFNQGRCFEQNNRYEDAIGRFREYLRKAKDASAADRADADKHIAECRALLKEKGDLSGAGGVAAATPGDAATASAGAASASAGGGSVTAGGATPVAQPSPVAPGAAAPLASPVVASASTSTVAAPVAGTLPQGLTSTTPEPTASVVDTATQPLQRPGRTLRIAGLASGAFGLASIGAGVYFYTRARSYSDKVSQQVPPVKADQDAGKTAETMQWVFYSVGGAAVVTGAVLYVLGHRAGASSESRATVAPLLGPGVAGISAQGTF
jgi:tetratricopeptide (TPR) repeat protein